MQCPADGCDFESSEKGVHSHYGQVHPDSDKPFGVECECNYCGDTFTVCTSNYERGWGKYCSNKCQGQDKTEKRTVECECNYCGDTFTVWKSNYESGVGKYCSEKCFGLDKRSANPDLRESPEYKQFRKTVLERDEYRCAECGDDTNLHVHHITPIYEDESLATDPKNGKTLCVDCHAEAHENLDDDHLAELIRSSQQPVVTD